jgi:hypothetical protein
MQTETTKGSPSMSMLDSPMQIDLRRRVAMHRAAQLLADAVRCHTGQRPQPLASLQPPDAEWYRQTARNLIEIFETETTGREPDAVVDARVADAQAQAARHARALESRLSQERSRARIAAADRGHDLTAFAPFSSLEGEERAACRRCGRIVEIKLGSDPVIAGSGLTDGCLTSVDEKDR